MNKKILYIAISSVVAIAVVGGIVAYCYNQNEVKAVEEKAELKKHQKQNEAAIKKAYNAMFTDGEQKVIKLEIQTKEVNNFKKSTEKLLNKKLKKEYLSRMTSIETFIKVRDEARSYAPDNVLKLDVTEEMIVKLQDKFGKLEVGFQPVIKEIVDLINTQHANIKELEQLMSNFFDGENVKETINRNELDRAKELMNTIPQKEVTEKYTEKIAKVQARMDEQEAVARAALEAERQAAVQAQLAESQRIAAENAKAASSNVIIGNIPMINQKLGVLNGCEGASLLMALQHFGYCTNMSLADIATAMPKSDNPHNGFIHDIFSAEPTNVPHWIAPDALAAFGQTYYSGVQNFTGASPDQLRAEIDKGNPVIFYATYGFYPAKHFVGEVPLNLHVMLLIGYNSYTGSYIVADPWGGIQINVSKSQFENSYNILRFAVVVRGGTPPVAPAPEEPAPTPTPPETPAPETPTPETPTPETPAPETPAPETPEANVPNATSGEKYIDNFLTTD